MPMPEKVMEFEDYDCYVPSPEHIKEVCKVLSKRHEREEQIQRMLYKRANYCSQLQCYHVEIVKVQEDYLHHGRVKVASHRVPF